MRLLYDEKAIKKRVEELALGIDAFYWGKEAPLLLIGVLKGSYIFLSDLSRKMSVARVTDFISISSYGESGTEQGEIKLLLDTSISVMDKHVLFVEDIVDSGKTMNYLLNMFKGRGAKSVSFCPLLIKEGNNDIVNNCMFYGFICPKDKWVVGYGMDYKEYFRGLPSIYYLDMETKI